MEDFRRDEPLIVENPYKRKKQPEIVRRRLLDCAEQLALERGPAAITVQAVAEAAGVTKGGLFHHFPSKQSLVEGLFAHLIEKFDSSIDAALANDPHSRGRFTRAYIAATFDSPTIGQGGAGAAFYVSSFTELGVLRLWPNWFAARLERHRDTDDGPILEIVRLATDGAWLAYLIRQDHSPSSELRSLQERLIAMTYMG